MLPNIYTVNADGCLDYANPNITIAEGDSLFWTKLPNQITQEGFIELFNKEGYQTVRINNDVIAFNKFNLMNRVAELLAELDDCEINKKTGCIKGSKYTKEQLQTAYKQLGTLCYQLDATLVTKLYSFAPKAKNGVLVRQRVPIYKCEIGQYVSSQGYASNVDVALVFRPIDIASSLESKELKAVVKTIYSITIDTTFPADSALSSIVDTTGHMKEVVKEKAATYIAQKDLIPGCVYMDKKGREHLYLGVYAIEDHIKYLDTKTPDRYNSYDYPYTYLTLTPKIREELKASGTFENWIADKLIKHYNNHNTYHYDKFRFSMSLKFVEQTEVMYQPKDINIRLVFNYKETMTCRTESYTMDIVSVFSLKPINAALCKE